MRIALVQPNTSTLRGTLCPPIGIMYVGAVARDAGHEVRIFDRNIEYFSLNKIKKFKPDIVGVTAMTGSMLLDAIQVSRKIKEIFGKEFPVVWGGKHATILPVETLDNDSIDYVVIGEGEHTFLEVIEALEGKRDLSRVNGLAYKSNGRIRRNPPRDGLKKLDGLPFLPWDMVQAEKYFDIEIVLVSSRGCPYQCTFCLSGKSDKGSQYRSFSPERVIEEIRHIEGLTNNKHLKFHDDFFTANMKYCRKIFDSLSEDYSLLLYTRANAITPEFLDMLAKFKSVWLSFGVESGSERMLEKYNKRLTIEDYRKAFALCKGRKNIRTKASVILGAPTETREEIDATLEFMKELNPTRHTFCVFAPYPGSALYDESVKMGLFVPPENIEGWAEVTMHGIDSSRNLGIDEKFVRAIDNKGWIINLINVIKEGEWYKILQRLKDYTPFIIKIFNKIESKIVTGK